MRNIIIIATCLLCACAATGLRQVYITGDLRASLMPLPTDGGEMHKQQIIASFQGSEFSATGIVEIRPEAITSIALADFGRIFTIRYTGGAIDYELSPFAPFGGNFVPEYVIYEIQMIYYPLSALKLPPEVEVAEADNRRTFAHNGLVFAEITYSDEQIVYTNHQRGYSYVLVELK